MLKTTWKTTYRDHVIEVENRPWRERLLVDGKEVGRRRGATFLGRTFETAITDGGKTVPLQAVTLSSKRPRGIRCTVSVDGAQIYEGVKWPARWYLAAGAMITAVVCLLAAVVLRAMGL